MLKSHDREFPIISAFIPNMFLVETLERQTLGAQLEIWITFQIRNKILRM
jgi:hypothetical protein